MNNTYSVAILWTSLPIITADNSISPVRNQLL